MGILVAVKNFIEVRWIRKFRNREDIEKYQDKMIKEQLEFMKNNSPYYKNILEILVKSMMEFLLDYHLEQVDIEVYLFYQIRRLCNGQEQF